MSQPPQNGWGQPPSGEPYGQPSPNSGYGDYGQQPAFAPSFGNDSAPQQEMQPPAPTSGKGLKIGIIACAGCAVIVLLLGIIGGGIFLFTRNGDDSAGGGGTTSQPSEDESEDPTDDETEDPTGDETDDPTGDETDDPTGDTGSGGGSQSDPLAAGSTITVDDGEDGTFDVTFGDVTWDATDDVMDGNSFDEAPDDGEKYISVPVSVTYNGGDSFEAYHASFTYVSGGNSYTEELLIGVDDGPFSISTMYDGGSAEWVVRFLVPEDVTSGGEIGVSALFDFGGDTVWVSVD